MILKYNEKFRLRSGDFNFEDCLTPNAVLDLFQEVAGTHAEKLGLGYAKLIEKDLIWLLISTKYVVIKQPDLYSSVVVETWPKEKQRIDFYREYVIKNEQGEDLVRGVSRWVVANYKTRSIVIPRDINYEGEIYPYTNFPEKIGKIKDVDIEGIEPYRVKIGITDLDHNGHVNNVKYITYILNAIGLKKTVKELEITYVKEASLNQEIEIYFKEENNTYLVKGVFQDKTVCFICIICY